MPLGKLLLHERMKSRELSDPDHTKHNPIFCWKFSAASPVCSQILQECRILSAYLNAHSHICSLLNDDHPLLKHSSDCYKCPLRLQRSKVVGSNDFVQLSRYLGEGPIPRASHSAVLCGICLDLFFQVIPIRTVMPLNVRMIRILYTL